MFKLDPKLAGVVGLDLVLTGDAFVLVDNESHQSHLPAKDMIVRNGVDGYSLMSKRLNGSTARTLFYDKVIWHARIEEVNIPAEYGGG